MSQDGNYISWSSQSLLATVLILLVSNPSVTPVICELLVSPTTFLFFSLAISYLLPVLIPPPWSLLCLLPSIYPLDPRRCCQCGIRLDHCLCLTGEPPESNHSIPAKSTLPPPSFLPSFLPFFLNHHIFSSLFHLDASIKFTLEF